jgi:Ala-tRNA(Pro) deacylase
LILEHGRPLDITDRIPQEIRTYDFLDSLGITYDRIDHPPADNMEVCTQKNAILKATICKNLFLCNRQMTRFYLLMMKAEKQFKTSIISSQIGSSRLSFATAEYMRELLDVTPGSVSVLALANDRDVRVQLLIDEDILASDYFGCHPCINTSSLKISTRDLTELILPATGHSYQVVRL